jgi:hypothetical protein
MKKFFYNQLQAMALANVGVGFGKLLLVIPSTDSNYDRTRRMLDDVDSEGIVRIHTTPTLALASAVSGAGDVMVIAPSYTTAITAAEKLSAETKGVRVVYADMNPDGTYSVTRATGALAQTADLSIFTITGRVELISIVGEVTTIIQTQANDTLLKVNPTVGADVDICAALDITGDAVGTLYNITGTLADAMVATTSGAGVKQASSVILEAGILELECAASNTGSVKWHVNYRAIDPGARIVAA